MKRKFLVLICAVVLSMTASTALAGNGVYFFFSVNPSNQAEDENVKVAVSGMQVVVYNKTDHVIYLNKETSFAYLNDAATCLFTNASYTTSSSQGSNTNVNLGGVARAMGVGGGLGALMSGIDVGGNQTQGSSTTTYEQKIVTIAPQSAYVAYEWEDCLALLIQADIIYGDFWAGKPAYIDPVTRDKTIFKSGVNVQYNDYNQSPLRLKAVINYYDTQDAEQSTQMTSEGYLSNIIVDKKNINKAKLCAPYKELPYWVYTNKKLYRTAESQKKIVYKKSSLKEQ